MLLLFEGWALATILLGLYASWEVWAMVDARLAEAAANSIGVETPITTTLGIKVFTLLMVASVATMISGVAEAIIVQPVLVFIYLYGAFVNIEGCLKDPTAT